MIQPEQFIQALDEANPSGPNLEYDPDFQALERAQQGRPEQVIGDSVKPGEDPDWRDVRERAVALLGRARDLRVAAALTRALTKTEGIPGLAAGLAVVKGLLEQQWDTVHPQLDAEDNNDPTSRVNSLLVMAAADGLLKALREVPAAQSKTMGRYGLRDFRIASGKMPAPTSMTDPPQQARIDAAFLDMDLELLKSTAEAASSALDEAGAIDRIMVEKVGGSAPELKPLLLDLAELKRVLGEKLAARGGAPPGAEAVAAGMPGATGGGTGELSSREDVVRQLERICAYYRRFEPSSPIPLLLERAKRLVAKDFMEIVRDMTPAGIAEAELFSGKKAE